MQRHRPRRDAEDRVGRGIALVEKSMRGRRRRSWPSERDEEDDEDDGDPPKDSI
jgi:hypothetical protein